MNLVFVPLSDRSDPENVAVADGVVDGIRENRVEHREPVNFLGALLLLSGDFDDDEIAAEMQYESGGDVKG